MILEHTLRKACFRCSIGLTYKIVGQYPTLPYLDSGQPALRVSMTTNVSSYSVLFAISLLLVYYVKKL